MYIEKSGLHLKIAVLKWFKIKMGQRSVPIFVNLKSNTMKNTMQRYEVYSASPNILLIFLLMTIIIDLNQDSSLLLLPIHQDT